MLTCCPGNHEAAYDALMLSGGLLQCIMNDPRYRRLHSPGIVTPSAFVFPHVEERPFAYDPNKPKKYVVREDVLKELAQSLTSPPPLAFAAPHGEACDLPSVNFLVSSLSLWLGFRGSEAAIKAAQRVFGSGFSSLEMKLLALIEEILKTGVIIDMLLQSPGDIVRTDGYHMVLSFPGSVKFAANNITRASLPRLEAWRLPELYGDDNYVSSPPSISLLLLSCAFSSSPSPPPCFSLQPSFY